MVESMSGDVALIDSDAMTGDIYFTNALGVDMHIAGKKTRSASSTTAVSPKALRGNDASLF
jgi:hypothetical protein